METWEVWYPDAAADGLLPARGTCDSTQALWLHAAPELLRVEVRDDAGQRRAYSDQAGRCHCLVYCLL